MANINGNRVIFMRDKKSILTSYPDIFWLVLALMMPGLGGHHPTVKADAYTISLLSCRVYS
jgi:hypothetical protein